MVDWEYSLSQIGLGKHTCLRKHKPEEIVAKLRQVDVLVSPGRPVAEAIRTIAVGNRRSRAGDQDVVDRATREELTDEGFRQVHREKPCTVQRQQGREADVVPVGAAVTTHVVTIARRRAVLGGIDAYPLRPAGRLDADVATDDDRCRSFEARVAIHDEASCL